MIEGAKIGRNTKKLYVGNLPANVTEQQVCEFLSNTYENMGFAKEEGPCCTSCTINAEKNFAMVNVSRYILSILTRY